MVRLIDLGCIATSSAQAGVHGSTRRLDSRLRGNDLPNQLWQTNNSTFGQVVVDEATSPAIVAIQKDSLPRPLPQRHAVTEYQGYAFYSRQRSKS